MDILKKHNVKITGKGSKSMVFSHGFGCDQHMWRFITPAFEEDYRIILFDHIGFGKADTTGYTQEKYSSLQAYADDVLAICNALSLQDVIFVGHSVSSMIGMLAAIKEPSVFQKLIMVSPSPCYINDDPYNGGMSKDELEGLLQVLDSNYLKWAASVAPVIMQNSDRPELSKELQESFCHSNREIAQDFAKITFTSDNRKDLEKLQIETLILQCAEDLIAPVEVGRYMQQHLQNSNLKILKASGHCPNLSAPAETIAAIKDYLQ